ncbi:MAG: tRNA (N6-threonylcarbamoyladenosine(37)-N6)-methyltransferase TrmO [Euryarchaeota archaeon RBG_19FT_COMBO_56_21]|nr:MAG: tRNA (N6-threonylcarbamoyladenosine(37)-N6)-methyltransferase TrmO [Euryarchaeota archaeon RBG_19FT_COMBO_56_21]
MPLKLKAIGRVRNGVKETPEDWSKVRSRIVIDPKYVEGLQNLDHFKHVWVIFGFNRLRETQLKVHPRHDPSKPLVGVFASRSPTRPNKLGLTLVRLASVRGTVLVVKDLDAYDGSPVYDIKPFEDEIDY